jgi:hypothetical protein
MAWFSDAPHLVCDSSPDWAHAVATLIDVHGSTELEWHNIFAIEATTRDGHAEFLIPFATGAHLAESSSIMSHN